MELWEDISKKVGDAANAVGRQAGKVTDIAKLKYNISVRKGKREKLFESIGELRYEEIKNGVDNSEAIAAIIADIDVLIEEINDLRARLDEITGVSRCPKCGVKIARGSAFCSFCGEKIETEE